MAVPGSGDVCERNNRSQSLRKNRRSRHRAILQRVGGWFRDRVERRGSHARIAFALQSRLASAGNSDLQASGMDLRSTSHAKRRSPVQRERRATPLRGTREPTFPERIGLAFHSTDSAAQQCSDFGRSCSGVAACAGCEREGGKHWCELETGCYLLR
jgi:hypothetical protein